MSPPARSRCPVRVHVSVEPAGGSDDGGDAVLAQAGPFTGQALHLLERVLGMRGQGVQLVTVVVEAANQPLPSHPLQAQLTTGPGRDIGLPSQAQLVQVRLDLVVQARRHDGAHVPGKRTAEDGDDDRRLTLVQQGERGLLEGALDACQLSDDVAQRPVPLLKSTARPSHRQATGCAASPRTRHGACHDLWRI